MTVRWLDGETLLCFLILRDASMELVRGLLSLHSIWTVVWFGRCESRSYFSFQSAMLLQSCKLTSRDASNSFSCYWKLKMNANPRLALFWCKLLVIFLLYSGTKITTFSYVLPRLLCQMLFVAPCSFFWLNQFMPLLLIVAITDATVISLFLNEIIWLLTGAVVVENIPLSLQASLTIGDVTLNSTLDNLCTQQLIPYALLPVFLHCMVWVTFSRPVEPVQSFRPYPESVC